VWAGVERSGSAGHLESARDLRQAHRAKGRAARFQRVRRPDERFSVPGRDSRVDALELHGNVGQVRLDEVADEHRIIAGRLLELGEDRLVQHGRLTVRHGPWPWSWPQPWSSRS